MKPVQRFEHVVRHCEFQDPEDLAFICRYDLTVDVFFEDEAEYHAVWYWKQQMSRHSNVSALLKKDFDLSKETGETKTPRTLPSEKADREKALAQLLSAAFVFDMATRGLMIHSFDIRIEITETVEKL